MADIAKAALRNRVLEHLGVLAAGETAATADATLVDELIDAAWERLRKFGLVPFPTSAIPSWAQTHLKEIVARDAGPAFGMSGERLAQFDDAAVRTERELARQVAGLKHNLRVVAEYF